MYKLFSCKIACDAFYFYVFGKCSKLYSSLLSFWGAGAIQRLHQNGLLTAAAIDQANEITIKDLIYPVCFLRNPINRW